MKEKIIKVGIAAVMAAGLAGCSSNGNTDSNNILTVGINAQMNGVFSPLYYESAYDGYAINLIYQSMLEYDEKEQLQPVLAKDLPTISEDGKTVTFKLKKGVKFSDGSDLTSSDVKYTFTVLADPSYTGRFSSDVENIEGYSEYHDGDATELTGIETPDDYTVVFHMSEPRIDAISTFGTRAICSDTQYKYKKGNVSKIEKDTSNPIGSGPYKLNKYSKATGASFVKNDQFKTKKGEYSIDKVIIKVVSTSTELNELKKGDVDYLPECVDPTKIGQASLDNNLTFDTYPRATEGYVYFNCAQGPTSDPAVRKALAYATDRQGFVDSFFSWEKASKEAKKEKLAFVPAIYANPASADIGGIIRGEEKLDGLETYEFNIDKANQILDEAGWEKKDDGYRYKDGQKLSVRFMIADGSSSLETLIPMIEKTWKDIGVDLKQTILEFNSLLAKSTDDNSLGEWEVSCLAMSFNGVSDTDLNTSLKSGNANNYARISDSELDSLLDQAMYTTDQEKSTELYKQIVIKENDLLPYMPLYGNQNFNLFNKRLKNMKTGPIRNWSQAMDTATLD